MLTQREFDDPDQAVAEAAGHLLPKSPGLERSVVASLIESAGVIERIDSPPNTAEMQPNGMHPGLVGHYIIRDDLLLSLENFMSFLKSAGHLLSGVLSLPTPAGIKTTVDGLYSLYEAFAKIAAKAWHLSDEELAVVVELRLFGPSMADALASKLRGIGAERVEEILGRFEQRDDNPSGFAIRMPDGAWRLEGV